MLFFPLKSVEKEPKRCHVNVFQHKAHKKDTRTEPKGVLSRCNIVLSPYLNKWLAKHTQKEKHWFLLGNSNFSQSPVTSINISDNVINSITV